MQVSRSQMYQLIASFEQDIRAMLDRFVLTEIGEEQALGELYEDALIRQMEDDAEGRTSILDYLDIRPEYDLLNRHRELLPSGLAQEVRELTGSLDTIAPIRHRVMHARPFREQDPERLLSCLRAFTQSHWRELRDALARLDADPVWSPEIPASAVEHGRIHHNLPLPECDDTGLLGRDKEVDLLVEALKRRRETVLTITGEGGIGKSALALEVASQLLDDEESPYESILWVSLKTERLTANGVERVKDSVTSLHGATQILGRSVKDGFSGSIEDLAIAIGDRPTLICFDNLETITGEEFVMLYEGLPAGVSYLVTSRQGIGQLERRVPLAPLSEQAALSLLNQLIRYRSIPALARVDGESRKAIVKRLRYSPLSIRWYLQAIETGANPQAMLADQSDLLSYCIANVLDRVSDEARLILVALMLHEEASTESQLVQFTSLSVSQVRKATQELVQGSLVRYTVLGDLQTSIEISDAAKDFLRSRDEHDDEQHLAISANIERARTSEQKRRMTEQKAGLAPWVVRIRTDADSAVADLLHKAVYASRTNDFATLKAQLEAARQLSPDFWEVYRVEAFIQSQRGNTGQASALFEQAYELAESDEHKAVVAHFYSAHAGKNEGDLIKALRLAQEAHDILDSTETQRSLGEKLMWNSQLVEAQHHLKQAISRADGRDRILAQTSHLKVLCRQSEKSLTQGSNFKIAWAAAYQGWQLGLSYLDAGTFDQRLTEAWIECAIHAVKARKKADEASFHLQDFSSLLQGIQERLDIISKCKKLTANLFHEFLMMSDEHELIDQLFQYAIAARAIKFYDEVSTELGSSGSPAKPEHWESIDWKTGVLARQLTSSYGFITSRDAGSRDVFFTPAALPLNYAIEELKGGDIVRFLSRLEPDGRESARAVLPVVRQSIKIREEGKSEQIPARVILRSDKGYLFAESDRRPGARIFVHASCFDLSGEYEHCRAGTEIFVHCPQGEEQAERVKASHATLRH